MLGGLVICALDGVEQPVHASGNILVDCLLYSAKQPQHSINILVLPLHLMELPFGCPLHYVEEAPMLACLEWNKWVTNLNLMGMELLNRG